jgi:hypothetical protein
MLLFKKNSQKYFSNARSRLAERLPAIFTDPLEKKEKEAPLQIMKTALKFDSGSYLIFAFSEKRLSFKSE